MPVPKHELTSMRIADLASAPYNPRRISEEALAGLRASVERFGLVQPIIFNRRSGVVVGGPQRVKAMADLGEESTDVVVVDLGEDEEIALNLALNSPHISGEFTAGLAPLLARIEGALPELSAALRLPELAPLARQLVAIEAAGQPCEDVPPGDPPVDPVSQTGEMFERSEERRVGEE